MESMKKAFMHFVKTKPATVAVVCAAVIVLLILVN